MEVMEVRDAPSSFTLFSIPTRATIDLCFVAA